MHNRENQEERQSELSDGTKVRMGLLITILGFCCGGAWWASAIKSKVDTLVELVSQYKTTTDNTSSSIDSLRVRMQRMEWEVETLKKNQK